MSTASRLSQHPTDDDLLQLVERWIDALAAEDYDAAFAMTEHDAYYRWSPDLIRRVVAGYGCPEPDPGGVVQTVTARATASGGPPAREVEREHVGPRSIADIRYDLPLNGAWSDLTATFRVESRGVDCVLILEEIHVF